MQTNGCPPSTGPSDSRAEATNNVDHNSSQMNGVHAATNGASHSNPPTRTLSRADQDIIRLIGQHLRNLGLEWVFFFYTFNTFWQLRFSPLIVAIELFSCLSYFQCYFPHFVYTGALLIS
jgi:hypothetical protein